MAAHPDDPNFASALAVDYEKAGAKDKCEKLLAPLADKLGTTEGARILGEIYASRGDFDRAYKLLDPYAAKHLAAFRHAQKHYEQTYRTASKSVFDRLKRGAGPTSFYNRYNGASKAEKTQLVRDYVDKQIDKNSAVKDALAELDRHSDIVPVALDLGMAILNRAQSLPSATARNAELKKAKKTFLSVRAVAANSPQYQLYLGQVYYWLGEHDKGQKLFDKMLASAKRAPHTLLMVGRALRSVGSKAEARALAEEAYNGAKKDEVKNQAALLRAVTTNDLDEKVAWFERADQHQPEVKTHLAAARADRALRDGHRKKAAKYLRDEIAIFEKLPESSLSLNNYALAYFSLYGITGEHADFVKAAELIDKAIARAPSDSVVVWNAASTYMSAGLTDVVGSQIDPGVLGESMRLSLLGYLYRDARTRKPYLDKLRRDPAVKKALAAMQRARLLAPKAGWMYDTMAHLERRLRDTKALRELDRQAAKVEFDSSDALTQRKKLWSGSSDKKEFGELKAQAAHIDRVLAKLQPRHQRIEFAIAAGERAQVEETYALMGHKADLDRAVKLAKRAYKLAPSSQTRDDLQIAYSTRALMRVLSQDSNIARLDKATRRAAGVQVLFALALDDAATRQKMLADADVKATIRLIKEGLDAFPGSASVWEWEVLRRVDPKLAEPARTQALANERDRLALDITSRVEPLSAPTAYMLSWQAQARGEDAKAKAILKRYADKGVPIAL